MKPRSFKLCIPQKTCEYAIVIGTGLLENLGRRLRTVTDAKRVMVVSDRRVFGLYGKTAVNSLGAAGFEVKTTVFVPGESSKNLKTVSRLYNACLGAKMERGSVVVALGGGVVGDLAGFLAATLLRGVRYVQVPTTLLSQVDSSVGGKVGVNHSSGKNLIGAFYQPDLVLSDLDTLRTLPKREFAAGMAEVVKYGVIRDARFFSFLKENRSAVMKQSPEVMVRMIQRCCRIKADVVTADETESGVRAILNYGHTIGHAIEKVAGYGVYLHGEAVSIGMVAASCIAHTLGMIDQQTIERQRSLLTSFQLPVALKQEMSHRRILNATHKDKKIIAGKRRFVLPEKVGQVCITHQVTDEMILAALKEIS